MPKFAITTRSTTPSRTPDDTTKVVNARNLKDAWEKARDMQEVKYGFREVVSVKEVK